MKANATKRIQEKRRRRARQLKKQNRRGSVTIMAAVLLVALMAMMAFSIDTGYVANSRIELKRAVDAGALAGGAGLADGKSDALELAFDYVARNPVAGRALERSEVDVDFGEWDTDTRTFHPTGSEPSAIRVVATRKDAPYFFGRTMGYEDFDITDEAIASYQPRDMMLVLDYSASMNDDSELCHIRQPELDVVDNLRLIYRELGSPKYGKMKWEQKINSNNHGTIKKKLGLLGVKWPYPKGNWDHYINYVKKDYTVRKAGYGRVYGYLTLVNYWLDENPMYKETPDLWKTSEQPLKALKDAVSLFLDYVNEGNEGKPDNGDRVGLSIYTSTNGKAVLEQELTYNFNTVESIVIHRQAGHYNLYTNIGDGIRIAMEHLEEQGRAGAHKVIVLVTDGKANRPRGRNPSQYALQQAEAAKEAGISILTISLGADADKFLMDQIAQRTDGIHFNIPGGQTVAEYSKDLRDVFKTIAAERPLKLVK